jgi:hypothetical protein
MSRNADEVQDKGGVRVACDNCVVQSGPRLGVSLTGNDSGRGPSTGFSIDGTQSVPPADAENTCVRPLDPTVQ